MTAVPFPLMPGPHWEEVCRSLVLHSLREPQQHSVIQIPHTRVICRPDGKRLNEQRWLHCEQKNLNNNINSKKQGCPAGVDFCPVRRYPFNTPCFRTNQFTHELLVSGLASEETTGNFAFHFTASFAWQSVCSDQREESQAAARFVFSYAVT